MRSGFALPPALQALTAQVVGWGLAVGAMALGWLPAGHPWRLAVSQALAAAITARLLGSARWWLAIHLAFAPLLLAAAHLNLAPGWYLAAFLALLGVYWSSYRTQVPLYLSNRATVAAIAGLVPEDRPWRILDLGSGTGTLLRPLAAQRPLTSCVGLESAPAPCWIARLLGRDLPNLRLRREDFWRHDWSGYDLIYAFLSPVPMPRVGEKARAELGPEALLVSNSFPIPDMEPDFVLDLDDRRRTRLYAYRPGKARAAKATGATKEKLPVKAGPIRHGREAQGRT
jgi:hypothetical protein